ncbi:hypothetical protein A6411_10705 [Prescottella equi]|uniref:hypothetical protein n=1 Tax=Rhodococcus hoagii TaxID=43767 RepID=UPI0009BDE22C|nr:hypothetical protein [Prescottella equi]OQQ32268.1 hypothetical protein A6411_10705 [Prescottella equi]
MTTPATTDKYITATEVAGLLGEELEGAELARIELLISFAAPKLRSLVPGLDQRVVTGELDRDQVRGTLVAAVLRAFESLRIGVLTKQEQFPEINTSYTTTGADLIWFSKSELAALSPGSDGTGGAFTIHVGGV